MINTVAKGNGGSMGSHEMCEATHSMSGNLGGLGLSLALH